MPIPNLLMPKHAVWPTKAPSVSTLLWTQDDWDRFADGYRPKDYFGDRYDTQAWKDYAAAVEERRIIDARVKIGFDPDPRSADPLFGRVIHSTLVNAIQEAKSADAPTIVAWVPEGRARQDGWVAYDASLVVTDVKPEFLCMGMDEVPMRLDERDLDLLQSTPGMPAAPDAVAGRPDGSSEIILPGPR